MLRRVVWWFKELKWFWQRGHRGWADCDTWNFDSYLSGIIADGLRRFQAHHTGYPGELPEPDAARLWYSMLDDIIFTFDHLRNDPYVPDEWDLDWYDSMSAIDAKYPDLPKEALTLEEFERYQRGWDHFRRYFQHLWD